MPSIRLTQRRVDALRPRRKVRDIRDAELKGYGVRVMPSGARRYFIHSQHRGKRIWKIIGDAAAITEPESRARARSMLAALRHGREPGAADPGGTLFETVAEEACCSARGLRADRRDKLLKLLDTGGKHCTPNNNRAPLAALPGPRRDDTRRTGTGHDGDANPG